MFILCLCIGCKLYKWKNMFYEVQGWSAFNGFTLLKDFHKFVMQHKNS